MAKVALITGVTGQDGTYLAEHMLGLGFNVVGAVRDPNLARTTLPAHLAQSVELAAWDMGDHQGIKNIVDHYRPCEIYNLAASSSGAGMYDDPIGIGEINGIAVVGILEAIRAIDKRIRFCQASSREIFGNAIESPQSERTAVNPRSPYGAAKLYADNMVRIYRTRHQVFACSAILYNHESPRRGLCFVTRKIAHTAALIKLGLASELRLGNLDARRDWGYAGDYVRSMWLMLQQTTPDDYVIASGEVHSVREFCSVAFARLGLDYRHYVIEDTEGYRPAELVDLVGDATKAREQLGWHSDVTFRDLVHRMVDSDLQLLSKQNCN